jgi:SAM-dependent methyltransferase
MNEERLIELLVSLHEGLDRLGPGNTASTLRALAMCEDLPSAPDVLDVGCGAGAQTLVLADHTHGSLVATDLFPVFLEKFAANLNKRGLTSRVQLLPADMNTLPFADSSFDLIWSEGAIYSMGFDEGLRRWRPLVRPGGYLVVSEASWFKPDPPDRLKSFWAGNYPAMRAVDDNLASAQDLGWTPVGHFHLPVDAWQTDYYQPLRERLPVFLETHEHAADAKAVAEMTELEMDLLSAYSDYYGYAFYVLHRPHGILSGGD